MSTVTNVPNIKKKSSLWQDKGKVGKPMWTIWEEKPRRHVNLGKYGSTNVKAEVLCIVGPGATVQVEHQVVLAASPGPQTVQPGHQIRSDDFFASKSETKFLNKCCYYHKCCYYLTWWLPSRHIAIFLLHVVINTGRLLLVRITYCVQSLGTESLVLSFCLFVSFCF